MPDQLPEASATGELQMLLCSEGLIRSGGAHLIPLTGGVSSEIYLVRDGAEEFVVKRALPQLKVATK